MFRITQGGSSNNPLNIAMKKNQAGIRAMIVSENCSRLVEFIHEVSSDLAPLDKIGASYRPFGFIPYGVDRRQFLEGFLLRMRGLLGAFRKGERLLTCCEWPGVLGQESAGRREIHLGDVDNQVNRAAATQPGFVVEPPAACGDDVVMLTPRAERRALGLGLKAVVL
jgi:hypothetical protein